jgi:hypothetical protein
MEGSCAALLKESTSANFYPGGPVAVAYIIKRGRAGGACGEGILRSAVFIRLQTYSIHGSVGDYNNCSSFVLKIRCQYVESN